MQNFVPLFIIIPILELWILIAVGSHLGASITIGMVIVTAVIGVVLIRLQGTSSLLSAKRKIRNGQLPTDELFTGALLLLSGVLLLTPGFITDLFGFAGLLPRLRAFLFSSLKDWIAGMVSIAVKYEGAEASNFKADISGDFIEGEIDLPEDKR